MCWRAADAGAFDAAVVVEFEEGVGHGGVGEGIAGADVRATAAYTRAFAWRADGGIGRV